MSEFPNDYAGCRGRPLERLQEPAPDRIQLLTGPRQVGKTTLLLEIAGKFGEAAVYAAGDEPDAALPGFWERRWAEAEDRAQRGKAVLLLDEVHRLGDWASRGSRGSGTFSSVGACLCMLSQPDPPPCASPRGRVRAWRAASNA